MGGAFASAAVVTHYPMNETAGVLTDVVGGVNQTPLNEAAFTYLAPSVPAGTYGPIVITPAQSPGFGTAVTGTGSSIFRNDAGNNALTNLTAPLTAMAWVNPASTAALHRIISGSVGDGANGWGWGVLAAGNQRFTTYGVTDYNQSAGTQVQAGAWQHVAVTFDGGTATFYVNGEQVDTKTGGNFNPNPSEVYALFGLPTATSNIELFNGTIDEVRVYNTLLTAPEIIAAATVPEPAAPALIGLAGVLLHRRRRRRQ